MTMPEPPSQKASDRLKAVGHPIAPVWIFGGALYFYTRLTWLLILENQAALIAAGERLRQLFTIG